MAKIIKTFKDGLVNRIEPKDAPRGSASDCLNWHILGDHIELRRGRALLGTEIVGAGRVSGLKVLRKFDGTQYPFYTYARKVMYHDVASNTNTEVSSDFLPSTVLGSDDLGEDISIESYNSPAGNMGYLSSPNSGFYKIAVANPGSIVDLMQKEYRGKIKIKQNRTFLWDRKDVFGGADKTGIYHSHVDGTDNVYAFTKQEELATGDGITKTFSGTLAFKASNSKETCFFVVIAGAKSVATGTTAITQAVAAQVTSTTHGLAVGDTVVFDSVVGMTQINSMVGVVLTVPDANTFTVNIDTTAFTAYSSGGNVSKAERFIDDRNGVLASVDGGTGTINYATGAYSVTFFNAVVNLKKVVAQYFREDSTKESNPVQYGGIANFEFSSTRKAGEGNVFRQDDGGGNFMTAESLENIEYCLHEFKTWALTIGIPDDTTGTSNLIFRDNVGIPYHRAARATGKGIFYVDVLGENPIIRVLDYGQFASKVIPRSVSDALKLDSYNFNTAVMFEWADYIVLSCKSATATVNDRIFMYNKVWKSWEIHGYRVSVMDILNGSLIGGDSGSNNIFKLFSGLTDEEALIENFYITNDDNLDIEGIKTVNIMRIAGYIGIGQGLKVSYSVDNEPFVEIGGSDEDVGGVMVHHPLIEGNGSYVDLSQRKLIGSTTIGEQLVGGGQDPTNAIYASPYALQFRVGTKRFESIRLKFEATAIGYVSVSEYAFVDVREKGLHQPTKYLG